MLVKEFMTVKVTEFKFDVKYINTAQLKSTTC